MIAVLRSIDFNNFFAVLKYLKYNINVGVYMIMAFLSANLIDRIIDEIYL